MQENEFEKQVKNVMEGLHLSPSAPVWEKIKAHIEKKKRRVWPFFLLLIPAAIFGGYFFYADLNKHHQTIHTTYASATNIKKDTTQASEQIKKYNTQKNDAALNASKHQTSIKNAATEQNILLKQSEAINHFKHNSTAFAYQSSINKNSDDVTDTSNYKNHFISAQPFNKDTIKQQDSVNNNTYINNNTAKNIDNNQIKLNADPSATKNTVIKNDSTKSTKKSTIKKDSKIAKWRFGIITMFGKSNLANNLNLSTEKSVSSAYVNPGTFTGNTVVSNNPYKPAAAYTFGIVIQRKIFKQSFINSGLNFIHLSNKSITAVNLNSSIIAVVPSTLYLSNANNYYRYGSQKTYTNTFNFIELPVSFESNIFHIKQFALTYNAGFSVMHMLSSTALIYDSKTNSFLSDNNLIKHTQFQLLGGLNFQLNTKHAGSFSTGPHIEYSPSTFLKKNDYNHLHFINYGLQATWLFHKK